MEFIPTKAPSWKGLDVGIANFQNVNIPGCYFDFFTLPGEDHAIFMGETFEKGVVSFTNMAILKEMVIMM